MKEYEKLSRHIINENIDEHIHAISSEFRAGFQELKKYPKSVTVFGSSLATPASQEYKKAHELAYRVVTELGYSIITGGGPGIMAAANLGAREAHGNSVGFTINLPREQHTNPYTTSTVDSNYFFTRKTMLAFAAETYVFFPGGFGTLDELFGILTLTQTQKIPRIPIILFGKDYWESLREFIEKKTLHERHYIGQHDLELFHITDSIDEILETIKAVPVSHWWKKLD